MAGDEATERQALVVEASETFSAAPSPQQPVFFPAFVETTPVVETPVETVKAESAPEWTPTPAPAPIEAPVAVQAEIPAAPEPEVASPVQAPQAFVSGEEPQAFVPDAAPQAFVPVEAPQAAAPSETFVETASEPVHAPEPAPAPEPVAPPAPPRQPELPAITKADPDQPKRSGWWARAKANFTGH